MALNQLPTVQATLQVVHSGPTGGSSFTSLLNASDGAPIAPQQIFTFDLNVYAPAMVAAAPSVPLVGVFRASDGVQVDVDIKVTPTLITLTFWDNVDPAAYRVKVMG